MACTLVGACPLEVVALPISSGETLHEVLSLSEAEKLLIVALLWCWWWAERNRGNHGEKYLIVEQFQFTVRRHVDEWKYHMENKKQPDPSLLICNWEPPLVGFVKINIDAAFYDTTKTGVGVLGVCDSWISVQCK
jgi:hypothetical protein